VKRIPCALLLAAACGGASPKPDPVEPTPAPGPTADPVAKPDPLDRFDPVPPEVDRARLAVALPPVPSFELPSVPEGFRSIKELRVSGARLFGTQVKVNGVVSWIYDCVTAVGIAGEKKAAVEKRIKKDPTLCEKPHFHVGASRDATEPNVVWVVDVPKGTKVAVGDRVIVAGAWDQTSPGGFRRADGVLAPQSIQIVKGGAK
jgi:hypothetical protein